MTIFFFHFNELIFPIDNFEELFFGLLQRQKFSSDWYCNEQNINY